VRTARVPTARGIAVIAALGFAVAIAGCAPGAARPTFPPVGTTPQPAGDATGATEQQLIVTLAGAGFQAREAVQSYRPPEGPLLAAAPRTLLEVPLPDDPDAAPIVIYAFPTRDAATAAARDQAAYIRTNTGGIAFPPGTRFVLTVVDATVVFFSWLPDASPDPGTARIAQALASIGSPIEVSR
jgi:hypothetical protein